jgi:hypothetical protein
MLMFGSQSEYADLNNETLFSLGAFLIFYIVAR